MLTSGRKVRKAFARSTTALLSMVVLASCASGEPEAKIEHLCTVGAASEEEALLRGILRADGFETDVFHRTNRVVESLERDLRAIGSDKKTFSTSLCAYGPTPRAGVERARFEVGWVPRTSKDAEPSMADGGRFDANGAFGESNYFLTNLFVRCDMPGDLAEPSKAAWLYAEASYTVNIGRTDIDQAAKDRQTALTYLMARRVTDALGCENEPLAKPPVVKPLPAP
ncbi:hypothetical protein OG594_07045 [Streptomyces sp. NBC_01214]|uniref:hypothetical protein n=1 Tax=Streptomyces sp. NBC_01214 TaxID=2903777 RepID=UPI002251B5D2|nr:hypothetical protein [Streptomyces sp. NBC_01214]MCX4801410.1 hypothetical protein [Streptomyces sp. NBC_01214]